MTRDLGLEVHAWLAGNGKATVEEIARGVHVRAADVRELLRTDRRFSGPLSTADHRDRRQAWVARRLATDGSGRVRKPTQGEQVLGLLADGRWHTTAEILRVVPCIVHSRVAEINKRGQHRIEHRDAGGGAENHSYRLVTLEEAESSSSSVSSSGAGYSSAACDQTAAPSLGDPWPTPLDLQLTLEVAA